VHRSALEPTVHSLCRLGEYREACLIGLHLFKKNLELDISIPFALLKSKKYRLSASLAIELAKQKPSQIAGCGNILALALSGFTPTTQEIDNAIELTKTGTMTPAMVAFIGSKISDNETRTHFYESYLLAHSFTDTAIALTKAYSLKFLGNVTHALNIAQKLVLNDPSLTEACNLSAEILLDNNYTYEARRYACLSIKYTPNDIQALELLGASLYKEARWKPARRIFSIIHAQTGDDISLLNSLITLPPFPLRAGDLSEAIKGFDLLKQLMLKSPKLIGIEKSLQLCKMPLPSEFYLAYEGPFSIRENLEAVRAYLRLSSHNLVNDIIIHSCQNKIGCRSIDSRRNKPAKNKIKIGFVSRYFSSHSNLEAHYGLIKHLSRDYFSIYLIHRPGVVRDGQHFEANALADHVIYLIDDFGGSCRMIAKLELDILFFTDVGMVPMDSVLAMPHLARYQVTSWGLPHTTGVKEIDYYMRSSIFSDCEGQSEYSEKLVDIDGYIGYFPCDKYALRELTKDYFLLPPDRFLIGCLQTSHKIHPDFDSYLEAIAKINESILIVMSPSESDTLMRCFIERLKHTAPTAHSQLCILARTTLDDFFSLNHILDLNLDTIHYGAGITFVQSTWCGPPYVTQQSNHMKGSVVSRSYKYAGIKKPPVAQNQDEYIEIVRFYFEHREQLKDLREEIQAKAMGSIYNNQSYITNYEQFFKQLALRD
jgi:hypothetical protein